MSVSQAQLANLAQLILNNEEAVEEVRNRYRLRMFDRFRQASPAQREIINAIMDNEQAFWEEFRSLLVSEDVVNEEEEVDDRKIIEIDGQQVVKAR